MSARTTSATTIATINNSNMEWKQGWTLRRAPRARRRPLEQDSEAAAAGAATPGTGIEDEKMRKRALRFSKSSDTGHYGLVSRGQDNTLRLNRHREREAFFAQIKRRFLLFCAGHDDLAQLKHDLGGVSTASTAAQLDETLLGLRKLREALLGAPPTEFTLSVYLYSIKVASRLGHHETYVPCAAYVIANILENPAAGARPSDTEAEEVVGVYVLHLAHFGLVPANCQRTNSAELSRCFQLVERHVPRNCALRRILHAAATNNYLLWFRTYAGELRANLCYRAVLERHGLATMLANVALVLNRAYLKVPRAYVEDTLLGRCASYAVLVESCPAQCAAWTLDGDTVVVRERRKQ